MNTQAVASPVKAATRMDNPASKIPYTFCLSMILSFLLLWFPGGDSSRANRFFYPISIRCLPKKYRPKHQKNQKDHPGHKQAHHMMTHRRIHPVKKILDRFLLGDHFLPLPEKPVNQCEGQRRQIGCGGQMEKGMSGHVSGQQDDPIGQKQPADGKKQCHKYISFFVCKFTGP